MKLKLYNTLSRKKEIFKPTTPGLAKIYTCGPTVYWHQHVGNFRSQIFPDVLTKVLQYNGYKVKRIINITDVGHLTSDADEGVDKIEMAAKKENKSAKEIARYYFNEFQKDFKKLNLNEPNKWTKATEHIKEQIEMIKILEKKGYTYKTNDGIYFDTSKFKDYGKLSRKKIIGLVAGKRISLKEKKSITDFALWKFSLKQEKRQQEWSSPWGIGFPGWHIECSAMASKYLGKHFDIHTGGEDNMPIHHENEIAQSESAFGKSPWVNFWMHGAFLEIKGGKMAKSKGNIKTISQLQKDNISPMEFKYFTYTAHYRKPLKWSNEAISSAQSSFKRLKNITSKIKDDKTENKKYLKDFEEKINDDLDMPGAISVLWQMLRDQKAKGKYQTIKKMDEVFTLDLLKKEKQEIPKEIKELAEERQKARKNNYWKKADELREKISKKGWKVIDEKTGYSLEKI